MLNREIYVKDPFELILLNNGVASVSDERSSQELKTLRFELETFVCDGEYKAGLQRILDANTARAEGSIAVYEQFAVIGVVQEDEMLVWKDELDLAEGVVRSGRLADDVGKVAVAQR